MKLAATAALLSVAAAFPFLPGPANQSAQPAWLAQLYATRAAQRASANYSGAVYDDFLLWSPSLHIVPQSHLYDRFLPIALKYMGEGAAALREAAAAAVAAFWRDLRKPAHRTALYGRLIHDFAQVSGVVVLVLGVCWLPQAAPHLIDTAVN